MRAHVISVASLLVIVASTSPASAAGQWEGTGHGVMAGEGWFEVDGVITTPSTPAVGTFSAWFGGSSGCEAPDYSIENVEFAFAFLGEITGTGAGASHGSGSAVAFWNGVPLFGTYLWSRPVSQPTWSGAGSFSLSLEVPASQGLVTMVIATDGPTAGTYLNSSCPEDII
jgi:hypothetical protein